VHRGCWDGGVIVGKGGVITILPGHIDKGFRARVTAFLALQSYENLRTLHPHNAMASSSKYLTGDREGIKEFVDRFDVSNLSWFVVYYRNNPLHATVPLVF